jgi:hypothetical protein
MPDPARACSGTEQFRAQPHSDQFAAINLSIRV